MGREGRGAEHAAAGLWLAGFGFSSASSSVWFLCSSLLPTLSLFYALFYAASGRSNLGMISLNADTHIAQTHTHTQRQRAICGVCVRVSQNGRATQLSAQPNSKFAVGVQGVWEEGRGVRGCVYCFGAIY